MLFALADIQNPTVKVTYNSKHFEIISTLEPAIYGLIIKTIFRNTMISNMGISNSRSDESIEVWFPISGHLEYLAGTNRIIIGNLTELGNLRGNNMLYNLLLKAGSDSEPVNFFIGIDTTNAERLREISDKDGVVRLDLHLSFSVLFNAGSWGSQKTLGSRPVFNYDIPKAVIDNWMVSWSDWKAQSQDLPKSVPNEVRRDYAEAIMSFNVKAFRASVVMSRRTLQRALEDKGASIQKTLQEQINDLATSNLLNPASSHLAQGVRYFGNYGAHPREDLLDQVTSDEAKLALDVVKQILNELYK